MTEFEFSLVLDCDPDDVQTEAIAGNVPSVTGLEGGGPVSLAHVAVDAADFATAVTSTVQQIEAFGVFVVGLQTDDLISIKEIATRTGRTRESVRLLAAGKRGPGGFPSPVSPEPWALYSWTEVGGWFSERFPEQDFDLDRQATAADHFLRGRHITRAEPNADAWAQLLSI
ncbi:hypothetical protein [Promicromonospora sp. NPDC050249]|jgi:hypothetical protein|uniref:hypothetical protein n=1 Tax=Promicromonospora sp. NPDC050249 TaxID=3154743 RepID=UPI0033FFFF86